MTTVNVRKTLCWGCGKSSSHHGLGSSNQFGSPDLDLRPPEMMRSTMSYWVQACPHCGYVAVDLAKPPSRPEAVRAAMSGAGWQALMAGWTGPEQASVFLRCALLRQADQQLQEAGEAALNAAWVADDAQGAALAVSCRGEAANLLRACLTAPDLDSATRQTLRIRLVDILRRAGDWAAAGTLCAELLAEEATGVIGDVLRFQAALTLGQDAGCYTIAAAQAGSPP